MFRFFFLLLFWTHNCIFKNLNIIYLKIFDKHGGKFRVERKINAVFTCTEAVHNLQNPICTSGFVVYCLVLFPLCGDHGRCDVTHYKYLGMPL